MSDNLVIVDPSPLDEGHRPDTLAARETQVSFLLTALQPFLGGGSPLHLLLFGKSGSGKTAIARHVLSAVGGGASIKTAYVNCWECPSLYAVADSLVGQLRVLFADRSETVHKLERLRKVLEKSRLVLVLDELDKLAPKERDDILYHFLQWPNVVLVCIAGSRQFLMELDPRILSRFTPTHVECAPYLADDIFRILTDRAQASLKQGSYDLAQLRMISVDVDGDARLAIGTLRRAAQLAEAMRSASIDVAGIARAFGEMKLIKRKYQLDRLTPHHRIIVDMIEKEQGISSVALWENYQVECQKDCRTPVALRTFSSYVARLVQLRIIRQEPRPGEGTERIFFSA